jgi:hypothetical protein
LSRRFDDPIPLPRGRQLVTLGDAGTYITKLPKAEHEAPELQAAVECLILVAEKNGPTMMARIGALSEDCGWVCETHPGRPWEGDHACGCGAGAPCPWCNLPDKDGAPRLPDGFRIDADKKGWRN